MTSFISLILKAALFDINRLAIVSYLCRNHSANDAWIATRTDQLTTGWKMANSVIPATAEPATRAVPDSRGSFPSAGGDIFARRGEGLFEVLCVMKEVQKVRCQAIRRGTRSRIRDEVSTREISSEHKIELPRSIRNRMQPPSMIFSDPLARSLGSVVSSPIPCSRSRVFRAD